MTRELRRPTFGEAIIPIIFMAVALIVGKGIMKWPTEICLLAAAVFAGVIAVVRLGYNWEKIEALIIEKIAAVMSPCLIVIFVGFMVATWAYCGTLPMLVSYGMKFIKPEFILVIAFIANAFLSFVSGAAWGSVASIGVAMMGVGAGLGVPVGYTAAAVVSGAYFGDKLSPLSDTTNLTAAVTRVPLYDLIRYLLWTTLPSTVVALIVFGIMGLNLKTNGSISQDSLQLMTQLDNLYKFGFWPLIPMIVILIGTFLRMPTIPVMLASSASAVAVGCLYQGFDLMQGVKSTIGGFKVSMIGLDKTNLLPSVVELLDDRGGLANQGGFLAFIFCAMAFAGIVTGTGMMDVAMDKLTKGIRSLGQAVLLSGIQCIVINLLTGSDGLNKIITTNLMMKKFLDLRTHPLVLARSLEDFGTMTATLVPWSAAGLYMTNTLGVSPVEYGPYCAFFFMSMICALFYSFTGIGIMRINDEQAHKLAADNNVMLDEGEESALPKGAVPSAA